jgi:hypothetical protein
MSNSSYIFFNKDGYPHNFQYNKNTESYEGKIIFDENSNQTFKTQSLHIFEEVAPINFTIDADLLKLEYNNNSGLTITGESIYKNEIITDIHKVNESDEFYSKWIYGNNFHKKFPSGTIIQFSGITGISLTGLTDFTSDQYFTILNVKKHAILIITKTRNDIFDLTFISGYISSLNVLSINDYNRTLSAQTFFDNLYIDKKFSILNSDYNDKIVSIKQSGITTNYLNDIKLNGNQGNIFTLRTQLFTERPKILQGDIILTNNIYMDLGRFAYLLAPEPFYLSGSTNSTKKEIIFQDSIGNKMFSGFTFIVESLVDTRLLIIRQLKFKKYYAISNSYTSLPTGVSKATTWNTIQFNGYITAKNNDIIRLSGRTDGTSGTTTLMHNRDIKISRISYNNVANITTIFTPDYIIEESGTFYDIRLILQPHQITRAIVTPSGDVSAFNGITQKDAYCYLTTTFIDFSQYYISGLTGSVYYNTINSFINKFKPALYQYGIDVYYTKRNNNEYLSVENLYGTKTKYYLASGYTNNNLINSNFDLTNQGFTNKYDIILNEKLSSEKTNRSDITKLYKSSVASEILMNLNNDTDRFGFRLTLNGNQYYIYYNNDTQTTINKFIETYETIFNNSGFSILSGYSSQYTGYTLNIISDIDIWDLEIMVNILSTYKIIDHQRNSSILLSGNEIRSNNINLFNLNLATGMIIKITGSTYIQNNKEYNITYLTSDIISLSYQGTFTSESNISLNVISREFIRKPRGEYNRDIYLRVYWDIPYDDQLDDSIFLYDMSGDQLVPYNNNSLLTYVGITPLINPLVNNMVLLNKTQNKELSKVNDPKYQQTVFNELYFKLEQLDSTISYNWIPEPLEIFIGYNSPNEGVNNRVLKIEKIEKIQNTNIVFSYTGYTISGSTIPNFTFSDNIIDYNARPDFNFISYGFKKNQLIKIYFKDQSKTNQIIFENVQEYKILDLSRNKIIIDSGYTAGGTGFTYFTSTGATFFFKIEVQPKEFLSCVLFGQTEIEDIRFKVNLNNLGVQLEDDIYPILYQSDIEDNAIDYTLYNRKRKEMLTTFREIYDYIGSYKSLINAINYFGYNDLQLYEYYKNIDKSSNLYNKLHKVLIPDIFDNTIPGWNEVDFISGKYQHQNTWKKTNLFNLAYRITDEDGNNVLIYSLNEVQYKLTKLKTWLRLNIIPISANLLDITGVVDTNHTLYQDYDESNQTIKSVVERNSTVVNFNYTATLNFGSDYLITVNFYSIDGEKGTSIDYNEIPQSFSAKIKTFYLSGDTMIPVQYYKILKNDLSSFSFNLDKYIDPYIYIETTTYSNDGSGLGYLNNKMFYFDEPRNFWLVNHNFDITKYKYYQSNDIISNIPSTWTSENIVYDSTSASSSSVETIVKVNTLNKKYTSQISTNNTSL